MKVNYVLILFAFSILTNCNQRSKAPDESIEVICNPSTDHFVQSIPSGAFTAHLASTHIVIDGCINDSTWANADWYGLNYAWMGVSPDTTDYSGRFKVLWDANFLYLFVEVVDDSLQATLTDGIENYWKGDYVEVFLDEDQSGGDHKFNHQAFAYHVSTEGHAIDKNTKEETEFFDDHVNVVRTREGNKHFWEIAIKIFDSQFDENNPNNTPVTLTSLKKIGFSLAYGDNDGNQSRENFMGSKQTHGVNNDEGYVNADVFGSILLVE